MEHPGRVRGWLFLFHAPAFLSVPAGAYRMNGFQEVNSSRSIQKQERG